MEAILVEAMKKAGVDPSYIYAYQRTGILLAADNFKRWPKRDRAEFRAALAEYRWLWQQRN